MTTEKYIAKIMISAVTIGLAILTIIFLADRKTELPTNQITATEANINVKEEATTTVTKAPTSNTTITTHPTITTESETRNPFLPIPESAHTTAPHPTLQPALEAISNFNPTTPKVLSTVRYTAKQIIIQAYDSITKAPIAEEISTIFRSSPNRRLTATVNYLKNSIELNNYYDKGLHIGKIESTKIFTKEGSLIKVTRFSPVSGEEIYTRSFTDKI